MQMSKTCIMLRPFFHVSKMQYLFLKIYKFLEVLVCIPNLKFAYKFQFYIHLGNVYFNEFNSHLAPRPLIENFPNYILLNIWVTEPCEWKMHYFIMMDHCHNQSAKYVLESNVNEIYFSFPIVTQVQGEETSSVEEFFLFIFLISKFWINVNQKIANLVEFTLEK